MSKLVTGAPIILSYLTWDRASALQMQLSRGGNPQNSLFLHAKLQEPMTAHTLESIEERGLQHWIGQLILMIKWKLSC